MLKRAGRSIFAAAILAAMGGMIASAQAAELVIESWRNDDLAVWQDKIIPAFEAKHPDIKVTFAPATPTTYDPTLNAKLDAGTAGDLIICRPFDLSLALYTAGHLAPLNDLPGMDRFSANAKTAWSTDDGKTAFCMPMASVLHGFFYNKAIFAELGLAPPKTMDEFFAVLDKIQANGNYTPMAIGTLEEWEAATMGHQNIGPNYWKGEEGRLGLIDGSIKLTDPKFVEPFKVIARWRDYLGDGFEARSYSDSQNLFTLGKAALYPAGSWEIATFRAQADFELGIFPPPLPKAGDDCYVTDQPDMGLALNAKSKNAQAARTFLTWVASSEFAGIYANQLPGFFSLQTEEVKLNDPIAQEFVDFRKICKSTMRPFYQILSRGTPNLDNEAGVISSNVVTGAITPEKAGETLEGYLKSWYAPHQK